MAINEFHGNKLRLARLLNGLGQAELADKLSVSRQYIHSLELDAKSPSSELISALASILNVLPEFFFTLTKNEVREEQCHFRGSKNIPQAIARQVIAHGTIFELLVSHLDSSLSLPSLNFPHIEVLSDEDIELAADQCREHWRLGFGPISNMCRVLENAGAVITYFEGLSDKVDALSINRPRHIVVRNTLKQSPARLRFDLAHECGHLIMHHGIETGDDYTEAQANRFASAFLMPRRSFTAEFPVMDSRMDWISIYELKLRWKTSVAAIIRRAKDLTLINDSQYYNAYKYLSNSGQRKSEQYDDRLQLEKPELIENAINAWLKAYGKRPYDLAEELGITTALLAKISGIKLDTTSLNHTASANVIAISDYQRIRG